MKKLKLISPILTSVAVATTLPLVLTSCGQKVDLECEEIELGVWRTTTEVNVNKKERYVLKGITIPKLARRVEFTITVGGGVEYNAPTAYYDGKKLIRDWGTYDFDISKHQGESGKEFIVKFDKELTSKITVEFWMN